MEAAVAPEPDPGHLDELFHALADPTRRAILARLSRRSATVTELALPFDISLPAVSKHLKVLEQARLISRDIDGRHHRCSLEPGPLRDVEEWIGPYRAFWEAHFAALDRLLDGGPTSRARSPRTRSAQAARRRRRREDPRP
jgi:DNA-binding transcriptional ArsR family regulator